MKTSNSKANLLNKKLGDIEMGEMVRFFFEKGILVQFNLMPHQNDRNTTKKGKK